MTLPPLTYLTTDSLAEGVGASQVLPYVEGLSARGLEVVLHTFEKAEPDGDTQARLVAAGVRWVPHHFGRPGSFGGVARVLKGARALRGAPLVHARSDLAAASALLARAPRWVWDVRSFWADQRIALGMLRAGSGQERVLRAIERRATRGASAIVTLAQSALPVLAERHGDAAAAKATVVPTCVDLDRFPLAPMPARRPLIFMLSGTLNEFYDVPAMIALVARAKARGSAVLDVVAPGTTPWDGVLGAVGALRSSALPDAMPVVLARSHVGLGVCLADAGVSLRAAMPTKLGEFLSTGRPVVVNPGLGDMGALLADGRCGVLLRDATEQSLDAALDALDALLEDEATPRRCRELAERHFSLDLAIDRLFDVYRRVMAS